MGEPVPPTTVDGLPVEAVGTVPEVGVPVGEPVMPAVGESVSDTPVGLPVVVVGTVPVVGVPVGDSVEPAG